MKLGKTIVAERETVQTESERMQNREKEKRRKKLTTAIVVSSFVLVGLGVGICIYEIVNSEKTPVVENTETKYDPTVEIIDEGGTGYVTDKIKQYVGKIERDFSDLGYKVSKAIVPTDRTREIDIYLDGRDEFYKCNLDRGTAVTAEDAVRMAKYLTSKDAKARYVDVRIEGRAYYM